MTVPILPVRADDRCGQDQQFSSGAIAMEDKKRPPKGQTGN